MIMKKIFLILIISSMTVLIGGYFYLKREYQFIREEGKPDINAIVLRKEHIISQPFRIYFDNKLVKHFNEKWLQNTEMTILIRGVIPPFKDQRILIYQGYFKQDLIINMPSNLCSYLNGICSDKEAHFTISIAFYNPKQNQYSYFSDVTYPFPIPLKFSSPLEEPRHARIINRNTIYGS